jgi:predicted  nucleic acid-binding Zn-ribbon protein
LNSHLRNVYNEAVNIPRLLNQLQEIDLAADTSRDKMARINAELTTDALATERAAIAKNQADLKALQHELRETSAKTDDISSKIKLHEDKLYGGRVTSPKELSSLQKDIELLKGHRAPLEDRSFNLMEDIDDAENAISEAETALQRHKETLEVHRKKLAVELKALNAELSDLDVRRATLLPEIPHDAQELYQIVRKQKGRALAKVEQGACRGCGIAVTAAWLHRTRSGEIVRCPSCNRILYAE